MGEIHDLPGQAVPSIDDLDILDGAAERWVASTEVARGARQVIRVQRDAIRRLRVALAKAEAERDSERAIRKIASDERTAAQFGGDSCPGTGCPPERRLGDYGICPICSAECELEGEVICEHPFAADPPVRPARPAG